jgi:hypothetical protein
MTASIKQEPFSFPEFAAGGLALAIVVLIAFVGVRTIGPQEPQDPSGTAPSAAATAPRQWRAGAVQAARERSEGQMPGKDTSRLPQAFGPAAGPSFAANSSDTIAPDPSATTSSIAGGSGPMAETQPPAPREKPMPATSSPAPMGAKLNPLNRPDAIAIQTKLRTLGYRAGNGDGSWSPATRTALRDFKTVNGLHQDDRWDKETEQLLLSGRGVHATGTFIGDWAPDIARCRQPREETPLIVVNSRGAETAGGKCDFRYVKQESARRWRVQAVCAAEGRSWNANISLALLGPNLSWSSERGTETYVRCLKP